MDRFKHRVFDLRANKYLDIPTYITQGGEIVDKTLEEGWFDGGYILETSIGFKDKNGNLIYKNDYIRDKEGNTYLIKWVDTKFLCVDIKGINPDVSPRQDWLDKFGFEIIGNIHEQVEQKDVK